MKKLVSLILIALLAALPAIASCESAENAAEILLQEKTITAVGSAFIRVEPDCADIKFGVDTYDAQAANSFQKNEDIVRAISAAIVSMGLNADSLTTSQRTVTTVYGSAENSTSAARIRGYRINQSIIIHTDDISLISAIIAQAIAAGASTMDAVVYGVSDANALYDEVLSLAVQEATRKAALMADKSNAALGEVLSLKENEVFFAVDKNTTVSSYPGLRQVRIAGEGAAAEGGERKIGLMFDQLEFTAKVTMIFKIESSH